MQILFSTLVTLSWFGSEATPSTHASIANGSGKRLSIAGRADLAATNEWLAGTGARFRAGQPEGFPESYWGLHGATEAYVFVNLLSYDQSTWTAGAHERDGKYSVLSFTIFGFVTDAAGQPIDTSGDGVIGFEEWIGFEARSELRGNGLLDSAALAAFYHLFLGANATVTAARLGPVDVEGYPSSVLLGDGSDGLKLAVSDSNPNRCTPETTEWERCYYFPRYEGGLTAAYPRGTKHLSFFHEGNNWVKFDATTDTYRLGHDRFSRDLRAIAFSPLFWVRGRATAFNFDSAAQ